jgi:acyl phosphate:glycerol-3-phosphate acyltransferase
VSGLPAELLVLAAALLLGSIPFGLLVGRAWSGTDVRKAGSGNIGATNVLRTSGPWAGLLTLALDVGKGAAAVALARAAMGAAAGDPPGAGTGLAGSGTLDDWAGCAAVVGHMFSPWLRFRGGKGVATALGALAVLSPLLAVAALAVFALVMALTRLVSLSSIMACAALPVLCYLRVVGDTPYLPVIALIAVMIIARHRANIVRLIQGAEPRFGSKRRQG